MVMMMMMAKTSSRLLPTTAMVCWLLLLVLTITAANEEESEMPSPLSKFDSEGRLPQSDRAAKAVERGLYPCGGRRWEG